MRFVNSICVGLLVLFIFNGSAGATTGCSTTQTLFSIEYLGACGYEQSDTFILESSSYVTNIRIWYDSSKAPNGISATLSGAGGLSRNQATEKGACYAGWCEGNFIVDDTLAAGTYTVTANLPYVCDNPSGKSTLIVYGCQAASSSQVFDVTAIASGGTAALTLDLNLKVATVDIGKRGSIYLGALVPVSASTGIWFLNNGSGWFPLSDGGIPAYFTGLLPESQLFSILRASDARSLAGTALYAGYGADASDMLARNLIKLGYTIPADTSSGTGSSSEVKGFIDVVMNLISTTLSGGLTAQIQPLLTAVLNEKQTTCPVVTKNISLTGASDLNTFLASLPNPLTANVDYGSGCTPAGGGTMSGQASLQVSDLVINSSNGQASGKISLAASNLKKDGAILADGVVSGNFSGSFASSGLSGTGNISLSGFMVPGGIRTTGTIAVTLQSASSYLFGIDVADSNSVNTRLDLSVQKSGSDYLLNTIAPGTVNQYAVTLSQVKMNTDVCPNYPIGGTVTFSKGEQTWTATFDKGCNGTYILR
jgi:hypothetical protein